VSQESLPSKSSMIDQPFLLKNAGMASLFLCCAKVKLLLAPKKGGA